MHECKMKILCRVFATEMLQLNYNIISIVFSTAYIFLRSKTNESLELQCKQCRWLSCDILIRSSSRSCVMYSQLVYFQRCWCKLSYSLQFEICHSQCSGGSRGFPRHPETCHINFRSVEQSVSVTINNYYSSQSSVSNYKDCK